MKFFTFFFLFTLSSSCFSVDFSIQEKKSFKYIKEYRYTYKKYIGTPVVPEIEHKLLGNEGPDKEVSSIISSLAKDDFIWWSSVTDISKLVEPKEYFDIEKEVFNNAQSFYYDWVVVDGFVFIGVKVINKSLNETFRRFTFKLIEGRWIHIPLGEKNEIIRALNDKFEG